MKLFRDDQLRVEALPEHEIGLMFTALEEITDTLHAHVGVTCLRIPADSKRTFILSDHPVSHYDETAPTPEAGISFMSSEAALTWVPLDPKFGLLLLPHTRVPWDDVEAEDSDIDELNLLTYAWARDAIYGRTQQAVTDVRHYAKKHPKRLGEFHYRAPRLWTSRDGTPGGGPTNFESTYRGETVKRTIWVNEDEFRDVA